MKCRALLLAVFLLTPSSLAQDFADPSFEVWGGATWSVNTPPDNWVDYTNGGLGVDEGDFVNCSHSIPPAAEDGVRYSRFYAETANSGEGISQVVSGLTTGTVYEIGYHYSGSNLYGGTGNVRFHTFLDDVDIHQSPVFNSLDAFWSQVSFTFVATASTHKIGFRAYTTGGLTGSAGMDGLSLEGDCYQLYCDSNPDNVADIGIDGCDCSSGSINVWLSGAPVNQFAYLLIGANNGVVTNPPGAVGDLCLGGSPIGRYSLDAGATNGSGSLSTDILNATSGGGSGGIPDPPGGNVCSPPGQTWNFQYWHRDGVNPSKFSKAITVTFH